MSITISWPIIVEQFYLKYDLIQGNKTTYKNSAIRYGNALESDDFIETYINELENTIPSSARTHTQTGIEMFKNITSEELRESYYIVQNDFLSLNNKSDLKQLFEHYERIKNQSFFIIFDKHKLAGELNSFFNKRVKNALFSDNHITFLKATKQIYSFVTLYRSSSTDISEMVRQMNEVDKVKVQGILNQYYSGDNLGPVNSIRREMLDTLIEDEQITVEFVEDAISELKEQNKHNWNTFSLLSGLYYKLFEIDSYEKIISVHLNQIIRDSNILSEYNHTKEFNMMGPRQQGAPYYGYCILTEKFKANEVNQVVFNIEEDISVFYYDVQTKKRDYITIINLESETLDQDIVQAFEYAVSNIDETTVDELTIKFSKEDFTETDYKQLIIDGAPGTGKSYGVNTEVKENNINHERVTFYSDYEYHNFIGSILPKLNGETVTYEFVKGPFTKILNDALSQPEDKHYLIVEELTRGNAAAIFGDIFQLLDRTEEGWSEYPITHNNILESLDPDVRTFLENEYEGKVVLPPNLSIICTINSSDQNVYPLDTAFKRRFDYKIESTNAHDNFVDYKIKFGTDMTVSWQDFYQKLNKYILVDLGLKEDKQVGPYFIKNYKEDNKKLESIQTKLAMYMWNDLHKVHTISNKTIFKDVHTLYEVDKLFRTGSEESIKAILSPEFRKHVGLDSEKQHFNLNDSSEITEEN